MTRQEYDALPPFHQGYVNRRHGSDCPDIPLACPYPTPSATAQLWFSGWHTADDQLRHEDHLREHQRGQRIRVDPPQANGPPATPPTET